MASNTEPLRLSSTKPADFDEREPLFFIDDQEYTIPKRPRANLSLQFLEQVKTQGTDIAAAWLMEEMLGTEPYEALMDLDTLEPEQLTQITELCQKKVLGKAEPNRAARRRNA
jgi:hypothetical protein